MPGEGPGVLARRGLQGPPGGPAKPVPRALLDGARRFACWLRFYFFCETFLAAALATLGQQLVDWRPGKAGSAGVA